MFPPSISDFKTLFNREFVYGESLAQVQDNDIQNGLNQAAISFNPGIWDGVTLLGSTTEQNIAYLYLAAFFLVLKVQGAGGLSPINRGRGVKSTGGGVIQSKSVGSVNLTYVIPPDIQNSPILGQYMRNDFGQAYLVMLTPRLIANVAVVAGGTAFGLGLLGTIYPYPLKITTLVLAGGTHNVAYTQTIQANGGAGQYTWTVATGTLPTGLTLGALTGILAGTPTVAGTYYFEIRLTDVLGNTTAQNYQVVIA